MKCDYINVYWINMCIDDEINENGNYLDDNW